MKRLAISLSLGFCVSLALSILLFVFDSDRFLQILYWRVALPLAILLKMILPSYLTSQSISPHIYVSLCAFLIWGMGVCT